MKLMATPQLRGFFERHEYGDGSSWFRYCDQDRIFSFVMKEGKTVDEAVWLHTKWIVDNTKMGWPVCESDHIFFGWCGVLDGDKSYGYYPVNGLVIDLVSEDGGWGEYRKVAEMPPMPDGFRMIEK